MGNAITFEPLQWNPARRELELRFTLADEILFDLDFNIQLLTADGQCRLSRHASQAGWNVGWLPRGAYRLIARPDTHQLPAGDYRLRFVFGSNVGNPRHDAVEETVHLPEGENSKPGAIAQDFWQLEHLDGLDLSELAFNP